MSNKILFAVNILLSIILIIVVINIKPSESISEETYEQDITIKLLNENDNTIIELNLEDYIIGVVAAEMPASFEIEALKAQAVASRTYALSKKNTSSPDYDLTISTQDQAYLTNEELLNKWGISFFTYYLKIREAVLATKDEVLTYNGKMINAFYFAMSNGYTEESELVFKEDLPYLSSVPSLWDNETLTNYEYTITYTQEEFCHRLSISCDNINITNIERSSTNRVLSITINDTEFTGTTIRSLLDLRSTDFTIDINSEVNITTKGYGHGVGMSQYGANGMAQEGNTYQDILNYYYQNIEITKINV